MMRFKELKRISSEEEYFEKLKEYKKKISRLMRKSYKFMSNPKVFIDEFENLLAEMEFIGLVSEQWSQGQRERLYREMNKPDEFKEWVSESQTRMKEKAKSLFRKG